jgi:hypothetical protein
MALNLSEKHMEIGQMLFYSHYSNKVNANLGSGYCGVQVISNGKLN